MTKGEELVRKSFNPSQNAEVEEMKRLAALCIDFIEERKAMNPRLAALAVTAFEEGAMWAVKCVTTDHPAPSSSPQQDDSKQHHNL